jgi:hypothetical protein
MRQGPGKKPKKGPPLPTVRSQTSSEDTSSDFDDQKFALPQSVEYAPEPAQFERRRDGAFVQVEAAPDVNRLSFVPPQFRPSQPAYSRLEGSGFQHIHAPMFLTERTNIHPSTFTSGQQSSAPGYSAPPLHHTGQRPHQYQPQHHHQEYYDYADSCLPQPELRFTIINPDASLAALANRGPISLSIDELLTNIFVRIARLEEQHALRAPREERRPWPHREPCAPRALNAQAFM